MARSIAPVGVKRKAPLARRAADKIEAVDENGAARKAVAAGQTGRAAALWTVGGSRRFTSPRDRESR